MILDLLSVTFEDRLQLPKVSAVYFVMDLEETIVYIGKTRNLWMRRK